MTRLVCFAPEPSSSCAIVLPLAEGNSDAAGAGRAASSELPPQPASSAASVQASAADARLGRMRRIGGKLPDRIVVPSSGIWE